MNKYYFFILIPTLLISSLLFSNKETTYIYYETTDGKSNQTVWTVQEKDNEYIIDLLSKVAKARVTCTRDYEFISASREEESVHYQMLRQGTSLLASGNYDGKLEEKQVSLGSRNWIQQFGLGFRPFLNSKKI